MTWSIDRCPDGEIRALAWSSGTIQYRDGSYHELNGRHYSRAQLDAVRADERTLMAAWPGQEPTAAQVAELCELQPGEVLDIWRQVGRVWKP